MGTRERQRGREARKVATDARPVAAVLAKRADAWPVATLLTKRASACVAHHSPLRQESRPPRPSPPRTLLQKARPRPCPESFAKAAASYALFAATPDSEPALGSGASLLAPASGRWPRRATFRLCCDTERPCCEEATKREIQSRQRVN